MPDPVIENLTATQRADTSFLVDVAFEAQDPDAEAALTLTVEWARSAAGPWSLASAADSDRRHDPEGVLIRPPLRRDLEGYYQFEGTGADSSALARPLTLIGAPAFNAGLIGTALGLVGNPLQYAIRPISDPALDFAGVTDFTVQVWALWAGLAGEQVLAEKFTGPVGPGWSLTKLATDEIRFHYGGPPGVFVDTPAPIAVADATYHQVVVRRRAEVVEIFFDGVSQVATSVTPLTLSGNPLLVGERNGAEAFGHNGNLDEVGLWTRSLTNAEIASLYNAGAGVALPAFPIASPGEPINFVWNPFFDLGADEVALTDAHVRVTVEDGVGQDQEVFGPFEVSTVTPTSASQTFDQSQARRSIIARTPLDFLGTGLVIPFRRGSRDFVSATGVDLIKSAVQQILGTRATVGSFGGELVWRQDFGSKLWILRHRANDPTLRGQAVAFVQEALRWEPRVEVTEVFIEREPFAAPNELRIRVRYRIIDENVDDNRVFLPEFEELVTIAA